MDKRLRAVMALFKTMKLKEVGLRMSFDYSNHEEWDQRYWIPQKDKFMDLPTFVDKTMEEFAESLVNEISRYNEYDVDSWWELYMTIFPESSKILITSECKYEKETYHEKTLKITDLSDSSIEFIKSTDSYKIDFDFSGRYDDGNVGYVEHDDRKLNVDDDSNYWEITNEIMEIFEGKYWNEYEGCTGSIRIWDEDIFINWTSYESESRISFKKVYTI
jgi:hypothetical protein